MEACEKGNSKLILARHGQVEHFNPTAFFVQFNWFSYLARGAMLISVVAFFTCAWPMTAQAMEHLERIANKAKHCVLHIWAYGPDNKRIFTGTGFFVSKDGMLVSNHHMLGKQVREEKKIVRYEAVAWNRKRYKVKTVLAENKDTDVALAVADLPAGVNVPYLKFALKPPRLAQQIVVIGNPTGLTWTVSGGIVSGIRPNFSLDQIGKKRSKTKMKDKHKYYVKGSFIQITAPTTHGSSGSPVINMNLEVVGVHALSRSDIEGANAQLHFASDRGNALRLRLPNGKSLGDEVRKLYLADAMTDFEEAIRLAKTPQDQAKTYDRLASECAKQGKYQAALEWLRKAVQCDPTSAMAQYHLGLVFWELLDQASYRSQCELLRTLDGKLADKLEKRLP